jgi:replicative DNA helicase
MTKEQKVYNPSIQALIEATKDDWGNPEEQRKLLVPYGIKPFDMALYGIDVINGELNIVMAPEKKRKTTFMINVIANIMMGNKPEEKPFIVVDTLESGMPPNRYRDSLISNVATRYLLRQGHQHNSSCPVCRNTPCMELGISPEFLRFNSRSADQQRAIDFALAEMMNWNLYLYGANPHQGNTRSLELGMKRWEKLIEDHGMKILIIDHLQLYSFGDMRSLSDYEKQLRIVGEIGELVAKYGVVVFLISQVSLTSQRAQKEGTGKWTAMGGSKAHQEANTIFYTDYESGTSEMEIGILDSRKSNTFSVTTAIEDVSGAWYGDFKRSYK